MMQQKSDCGLPCTFKDNGELLKKALLQFPRRYQHVFGRPAKVDLRRLLYFAASYKGHLMKHLFPEADESTLPKAWQHVLAPERYQHLESQDFYFQRGLIDDPAHPHRACGNKFKKGEPVYRCVTCSEDETSGLCLSCFDADQHEGHDVIASVCQRENGGVCDCGDANAWKAALNCKHFDFEETPSEDIPEKLSASLLQTFEIILDYIIDVMSGSSATLPREKKQDNESILVDTHRSTLEQNQYFGTDWPSEKFHLVLYNDQNRQYRDAVQRITTTTGKAGDFSLMIADEVNLNGRAIVMTSANIEELLKSQDILEATGLPSCIRNARDLFREEMCSEMILWLTEMMNGPIYGNYNISRDLLTEAFCKKWKMGVKSYPNGESPLPGSLFENMIPNIPSRGMDNPPAHWNINTGPWDIDEDIAKRCDYDPNFSSVSGLHPSFHGSRFQYLLYFDIRLWKNIRSNVHNLFNTVLTSNEKFRPLVCAQYVDVYPTMLELFFLYDREPESSCMTSFTSQIFTSPINATLITNHGDLTRFMAAAYGYLTRLMLVRPEDVVLTSDLLLASFKNRRVGQVIFDICCVLTKTESFAPIVSPSFIEQVCDILALFQGKPTLKREALEHVEYESTDYALYFNMYSVISSLGETIAKTLVEVNSFETADVIPLIFKRVGDASVLGSRGQTDASDVTPLDKVFVETIEGPQEVSDFHLHSGTVSFLHPLHAFASWLVQYSDLTDSAILTLFLKSFPDLGMILLEYPLRTLALLAQIRVGFWVRNGFSIRTQQHIYRTSGIRESGFKRDLYMVQLMMCMLDRDFVLTSFLSRWDLLPWLKEDHSSQKYDGVTLPLIVEEFLLMLIQLFTETSSSDDPVKVVEDRVKSEIIHTLCFQPMSYSKLCSETPDYLTHEKRFELILRTVADYIPPSSSTSTGLYKLKEEFLDEVDPYYIHYSSNKRDEAEKLVKDRISKKKGIPVTSVFIEPKLKSLDGTPFQDLFKITSSKIFVQFLRSTLKVINQEGIAKAEPLLELSLHLIHVASVGSEFYYSSVFNELIWSEFTADHNEPFYYESVGSLMYKFLTDDSCSAYHSKIRAIFKLLKEKNISVEGYLNEQVQNFNAGLLGVSDGSFTSTESEFEKKKRLAKERRAKIMAKFKKQQNKFVQENNIEEEAADTDMDEDTGDNSWRYPEEHCILCQMSVSSENSYFGVVCNVSRFSGSRTVPFQDKYWTLRGFEDSGSLDHEESTYPSVFLPGYFEEVSDESVIGPAFPSQDGQCLKSTSMITGCGHGMHYSCYQNYIISAKSRQTQITRTVPEDFENSEFICPLCKSLGNMFVPILWNNNKNKLSEFIKADDGSWYESLEKLHSLPFSEPDTISDFTTTIIDEVTRTLKPQHKNMFDENKIAPVIGEIWMNMLTKLESVAQPLLGDHFNRLVSNTIKGTEISLRGLPSDTELVTDLVSNQNLTTLRILAELKKCWTAWACYGETVHQKFRTVSINFTEETIGKLLFFSSEKLFDVFEDVDFFDLVVSCTPYAGVSSYAIYRMGFTYHFIQTLATILAQISSGLFEGYATLFDITVLNTPEELYPKLMSLARSLRDNHPLFDNVSDEIFESDEFLEVLYTMVIRSVTPFLRKVAIWSIANCADYSNVELDPQSGDLPDEGLEANRLCRLLNLPTVEELISLFVDSQTVEGQKFSSFVRYASTTDNELAFKSLEYPGQVRLIDLPEKMDEIFTKLLYKKNKLTSLAHFDPAICLFCGTVLNLQKKAAGQDSGECNHHAQNECLNDVGIFLLPKHSSMLLLDKGNGSFHPAPYIDAHGEYDSEIRQTQVLTLSKAKYDLFTRQMWLQHDVKNYITRKLEGTLDIGGWETL